MKGLEAAVVTLNSDKCEFGSSQRTTISMKWLCGGVVAKSKGSHRSKQYFHNLQFWLSIYSPKPPTKLSAVALS